MGKILEGQNQEDWIIDVSLILKLGLAHCIETNLNNIKIKEYKMAYVVMYHGAVVAGPFIHWQDAEKARAEKAEESGMMRGEFDVKEI